MLQGMMKRNSVFAPVFVLFAASYYYYYTKVCYAGLYFAGEKDTCLDRTA